MALIENLFRLIKGKPILRVNDSIASIAQAIFQECVRYAFIFFKKSLNYN